MAPAKSGGPRRNLEEDSADLAGIGNELYEDYENIFNDIFEGDYEYGPFEEEEDDDDSVSNAEENEDDDSDDEDDSSKYDIEFVTNALNATTIEDLEPSLAEDGYRIQ